MKRKKQPEGHYPSINKLKGDETKVIETKKTPYSLADNLYLFSHPNPFHLIHFDTLCF